MKSVTATGKTVEEAVKKVVNEYALQDDEYEVNVIEKGSKGFLGMFSKEAEVEVVFKKNYFERKLSEFLKVILEKAKGVELVSIRSDGKTYFVSIDGPEIGKLIGKHGKTLGALQHILSIFLNRLSDVKLNVVIDAGNYRERRKKQLEIIAKDAIRHVLKNKDKVVLDPMFPFERRIVHEIVKRYRGVTSYSVGVEPYRRVVIEYSMGKARRGVKK